MRLKNELESAMVNELSVFELLKFYCNLVVFFCFFFFFFAMILQVR